MRGEVLRTTFVLLSLFIFIMPSMVSADPPPWAPAHGWRKKHDPEYVGYTGKKWQRDYGVVTGRCDYEAVGAVVGGVVGGAVGAKVGDKEARPVAILVGAVIGSVVGARIGRSIEDADRACIGHSLELAKDHQKVGWKNPKTGIDYLLTPGAGYQKDGRTCRNFDLRTTLEGRSQSSKGKACQTRDGTWKVISRTATAAVPRQTDGRGPVAGRLRLCFHSTTTGHNKRIGSEPLRRPNRR